MHPAKHHILLPLLIPVWIFLRILRAPIRPFGMLRSAKARAALYRDLLITEQEKSAP